MARVTDPDGPSIEDRGGSGRGTPKGRAPSEHRYALATHSLPAVTHSLPLPRRRPRDDPLAQREIGRGGPLPRSQGRPAPEEPGEAPWPGPSQASPCPPARSADFLSAKDAAADAERSAAEPPHGPPPRPPGTAAVPKRILFSEGRRVPQRAVQGARRGLSLHRPRLVPRDAGSCSCHETPTSRGRPTCRTALQNTDRGSRPAEHRAHAAGPRHSSRPGSRKSRRSGRRAVTAASYGPL